MYTYIYLLREVTIEIYLLREVTIEIYLLREVTPEMCEALRWKTDCVAWYNNRKWKILYS